MRKSRQAPSAGGNPRFHAGPPGPSEGAVTPEPLAVAFRLLARRPYSIAELRQALEKKFPHNPKVGEAVARLRELGYLDDREFAEQTAYSLAQNRALGPHRVRRELKARKVDYQYVEPAVQKAYQETPARELLEQALDKKLRAIRLPLTPMRFHSLCQSLMRRGFSASDIIKAVRARPELQPVSEDVEVVDLEADGDDLKL